MNRKWFQIFAFQIFAFQICLSNLPFTFNLCRYNSMIGSFELKFGGGGGGGGMTRLCGTRVVSHGSEHCWSLRGWALQHARRGGSATCMNHHGVCGSATCVRWAEADVPLLACSSLMRAPALPMMSPSTPAHGTTTGSFLMHRDAGSSSHVFIAHVMRCCRRAHCLVASVSRRA